MQCHAVRVGNQDYSNGLNLCCCDTPNYEFLNFQAEITDVLYQAKNWQACRC